MLTYHDIEIALKRVPIDRLPKIYEAVLAEIEYPYDASPAEMEADDEVWDKQFATDDSKRLFSRMVAEARAELKHSEPLEKLLAEDEAGDELKNHPKV